MSHATFRKVIFEGYPVIPAVLLTWYPKMFSIPAPLSTSLPQYAIHSSLCPHWWLIFKGKFCQHGHKLFPSIDSKVMIKLSKLVSVAMVKPPSGCCCETSILTVSKMFWALSSLQSLSNGSLWEKSSGDRSSDTCSAKEICLNRS